MLESISGKNSRDNFIAFIAEVIIFYYQNPGGILEEYRSHPQNFDQKVGKISVIVLNLAFSTSPDGILQTTT